MILMKAYAETFMKLVFTEHLFRFFKKTSIYCSGSYKYTHKHTHTHTHTQTHTHKHTHTNTNTNTREKLLITILYN